MPRLIASLLALAALLIAVPTASAQGPRRRSGRPPARRSSPARSRACSGCTTSSGRSGSRRARTRSSSRATSSSPTCPGTSSRFKPDLTYADGTVPRVDVIHLHHGVWISNFAPLFAAGEEKTIFNAPDGYGWAYKPQDNWIMNHMIHNLTPSADATSTSPTSSTSSRPGRRPTRASATSTRCGSTSMGRQIYPVFDVHKGAGRPRPPLHLPAGGAAGRALARATGDGRGGRRARRHRRATCTRAGCGPT